MMVGGDKAIFDKYYDLMKAMAGSVVHTGEIGAGNVTKLANQVIVALNIAAMSEALTLATKAGVNPDLVYQAIRGGLAGSTVLDAKAPMVMDRNFKPGFRIDLHIKDLANALDTLSRRRRATAAHCCGYGDDAGTACRWFRNGGS
ncbi:hypothetical protein EIMP300_20750 [Escherichia coli]|uniref:3-hydroxyisobutyrate dehydrogenase-like NAD-binding domain-containing protein n=1 Tax=Escherichia coli TaxID=562 RepID=A0A8S0FK80_ECOLX|nr:hypothetical protein EIMP300_20750 [Escherichia coli]